MPFCPMCRSEFREGFTHCADCDCDLVEALPEIPRCAGKGKDEPAYAFLTNIEDGPLGESTLSVLRAYEIPFKTGYSDLGLVAGIYTGRSMTGLDVYVPQDMAETARSLIQDATFDLSEAAVYSYAFCPESWEFIDEIRDILDEYRKNSFIPVDECLTENGENYVIESQDMVFAVVRVTESGQFMIYPHSEHIETETFDAAFKEGIKIAQQNGLQTLWAELPRDETCFIAQYLKNGFYGENNGVARDFWGQEVEFLKLSLTLQDATE